MRSLTRDELARDFRELGLRAGMGVMVHSSLRSLGRTREGPKTVVEALMEALTEDGTLLMPSFNHGAAFEPGVQSGTDGAGRKLPASASHYSPLETGCTNGAVPDYFWRRPDVLRTLNPTHAFAGWGRKARRYLKDHHRTVTMGPESPLGRLGRDGGHCLFIGTGYGSNSFKHVVEMTGGAPCIGVRTESYPVRLPDGREVRGRTWGWREKGCPISDPQRYAPEEMGRRGLELSGCVGAASCTLYKLDDFHRVLTELLSRGVDGHPPCGACPIRPRKSPWTVESDWDRETDRLMPDSEAWSYADW